MAMDLMLKALNKAADAVNLRVTRKGDLYTAKRIPDFASAVMAGKVWSVLDQTTTAVLAAVAPTTTSGLTVQNPAGSGKWYVVYALSAVVDVVPGTLGRVSIMHCAHKLAVVPYTRDITLPATGAGAVMGHRAGQGAYPGVIILDRGATVVDDGWTPTPLFLEGRIATTDFMAGEAALNVPIVIPPSFHYSMHAIATVVTYQLGHGLIWGEFDEDELD